MQAAAIRTARDICAAFVERKAGTPYAHSLYFKHSDRRSFRPFSCGGRRRVCRLPRHDLAVSWLQWRSASPGWFSPANGANRLPGRRGAQGFTTTSPVMLFEVSDAAARMMAQAFPRFR
jgi:hypothetical protein